jgi:RNA polymerase subunit RPABC4/transcription elongation factor Spt4
MSIQVVCPNGHVLKVTDDWAGKRGLCPICKARLKVPKPSEQRLSEDDVLSILGSYDPSKSRKKPTDVSDLAAEEAPKAFRRRTSPEGESKTTVDGPAPPKKSCPNCNQQIVAGIHICPHCNTYIAGLDDF